MITAEISIPTIGIGAGKHCNGQVLVYHDLLGLYHQNTPKFVKQYANLNNIISDAVMHYRQDVIQGKFPADEQSFKMDKKELQRLKKLK